MKASRPPSGRAVPGNRWDLVDGLHPLDVPSVSVVVAHFRQQEQLDRTLAALARQTHPRERLEIVVVDDGSPEAPRVPDGVRLIVQADEGFRLAAARNLGAAQSSGDILVFLDADTAPEPEYIARLTRLPALVPEVVAVGHRCHADFRGIDASVPVESIPAAAVLPEPQWLLDHYGRSRDLLDSDNRSYRYVIGAVIACSRWFFDEVGGFDEGFREYGGEDWEWAHRAWIGGAVLAHVPDAVAWHDGPDWAGRDDSEGRRRKNAETLLLSRRIPVTGSRGRAVRSPTPDVVVRLRSAPDGAVSDGRVFIAVDSVLAALPQATVVVPDGMEAVFADDPRVVGASEEGELERARVTVDLPMSLRVDGDASAFADAVEAAGIAELGEVRFTAADGSGVLVVTSRRAVLRRDRWRDDSLFTVEEREAAWLSGMPTEPGIAAYLGGWG